MNYSLHPIQYNEDDRAQRYLNVFEELGPGQINISYVNSTDHIVAWHKHNIQIDYWCCIKGSFKVGLAGIYHGYKALEPGSILMYYLTEKYNPADELRAHPGDFKEIWHAENK